jgi:hypothetical protein
LFFSSGKMSSDDSPPRVRQRIEESVADKHLCMEKWQVLSKRNLLCADLRDPILLPIGQMIQENQWEYLYNCACSAFPRLVREFYGHMIIIQDDDRGLIMQTMSEGTPFRLIPSLLVLCSGSQFCQFQVFLSLQELRLPAWTSYMISLGLDHRGRRSPNLRSVLVLFPLCTSSWQR